MFFSKVAVLAFVAMVAASPAVDLFGRTSCSTPDGSGTCMDTSSCTGFHVAGYCPGASNIQCCISKSCSTPSGSGSCKNTGNSCSGSFVAGYCPGDSSIECCVPSSGGGGGGGSCSTPDGDGTCKDTSSCDGFSVPGHCPGASNIQCCVSKSCSTPQGTGSCRNTYDACSGSFVAGYCPGDSSIECCVAGTSGGGGGTSGINGPISRTEIINRAMYWINLGLPYSQTTDHADQEGTEYRTDCSGFVSMALHTTPPGYSTVSLTEVATAISWDELQQGDFVGTLGPGTGGNAGHVTLFQSWTDSSHTAYHSLECQGGNGCVRTIENKGWTDSGFTAKPYKYIHVK